jgi:hypothetical protein
VNATPQARRLRVFVALHGVAVAAIFTAATVVGARCGATPEDVASLRDSAPGQVEGRAGLSSRGTKQSSHWPSGPDASPNWARVQDPLPPWLER